MIITIKNILKILPVVRFELYSNQICFLLKTNLITKILLILKNHFNYQFKMLTCISCVDYPKNKNRFCIVYELLSLKYNSRIRVKILANELSKLETIEHIFLGAAWWESEIWDMFGVYFNQKNLTRLLTDYGFKGYPLRKDFPLTGFSELQYNFIKTKVAYKKIELAQEFRTFTYESPWENSY